MDTPRWALGTMVIFGFPPPFAGQLALASRLGATHLELYVNWKADPDPCAARDQADAAGLVVHSVHAAWGSETIDAERIDLSHPVAEVRGPSVAEVGRCLDWAAQAGADCLVVHPGVLASEPGDGARRSALGDSLAALAEQPASHRVRVCVENMPPSVWPGNRVAELRELIDSVGSDRVGLCLDTGHAHLQGELAQEIEHAGSALCTTHVHDNDGQRDRHLLPGYGTIDWLGARRALARAGYRGVLMLECVAHFRDDPAVLTDELVQRLAELCRFPRTDPV